MNVNLANIDKHACNKTECQKDVFLSIVAISAVLLRTHMQRVTEITLTIICLGKKGQLNGMDLPKTRSNNPDNEGHLVKPDQESFMNYFLFLDRADKTKNSVLYKTTVPRSKIQRD